MSAKLSIIYSIAYLVIVLLDRGEIKAEYTTMERRANTDHERPDATVEHEVDEAVFRNAGKLWNYVLEDNFDTVDTVDFAAKLGLQIEHDADNETMHFRGLRVIDMHLYQNYLDMVDDYGKTDELSMAEDIHGAALARLRLEIAQIAMADMSDDERTIYYDEFIRRLAILDHPMTDAIRCRTKTILDIDIYREALIANADMGVVHEMVTAGYTHDLEIEDPFKSEPFRWLFDVHLYSRWQEAFQELTELHETTPDVAPHIILPMIKIFDDCMHQCGLYSASSMQRICEELQIVDEDFIDPLRKLMAPVQ